MAFDRLPYDLLLSIVGYLDLSDVHALHLTCRAVRESTTTRPVYRRFAWDLLARSRALPLQGFQRVTDLSTPELIHLVNTATRLEKGWRRRAPRLATYTQFHSPPGELVDWLSPITSDYTLCATKSGKVFCWDVKQDTSLAQMVFGTEWELWKCRVEFDHKSVFFAMARVLNPTFDDERLMEFSLARLQFYTVGPPKFHMCARFRTLGIVMNVFLLDPSSRLLAAFIWLSTTSTIGLYVLLDWETPNYIFLDTQIDCESTGNYSCILDNGVIVIHSEAPEMVAQYSYPLYYIEPYAQPLPENATAPSLTAPLPPIETNASPFLRENPFPYPPWYPESAHFVRQWWPSMTNVPRISCAVILLANHNLDTHDTKFVLMQHYFRVPMNPSVEGKGKGNEQISTAAPMPVTPSQLRVGPSSDQEASLSNTSSDSASMYFANGIAMRPWFVSTPFEVACVFDDPPPRSEIAPNPIPSSDQLNTSVPDDDTRENLHPEQNNGDNGGLAGASLNPVLPNILGNTNPPTLPPLLQPAPQLQDDEIMAERPRPLLAVDFGHAVWIEYCVPGNGPRHLHSEETDQVPEDDALSNPDETEEHSTLSHSQLNTTQFGPFLPQMLNSNIHLQWFRDDDGTPTLTDSLTYTDTHADTLTDTLTDVLDDSDFDDQFLTPSQWDPHYMGLAGPANSFGYTPTSPYPVTHTNGPIQISVPTQAFPPSWALPPPTPISGNTSSSGYGHSSASTTPEPPKRKDHKRLRFVTFPSFSELEEEHHRRMEAIREGKDYSFEDNPIGGVVQTLEIPPDLDLDSVETINLDQGQGAIILSVKEGTVFILHYE